jgi:HEAT repeat protein
MWRRAGDYLYSHLLLCILIISTLMVGALAVTFTQRLFWHTAFIGSLDILVAAVVVTFICACTLIGFIIIYHSVSQKQHATDQLKWREWVEQWTTIFLNGEPFPQGKLSRSTVRALVELLTVLEGVERARLPELVAQPNLRRVLIRGLRARASFRRIETLDIIGVIGLAELMHLVVRHFDDRHRQVRFAAVRAAASIVSRLPRTSSDIDDFAVRLMQYPLPPMFCEEILLLCGENAPQVVTRVLQSVLAPSPLIRSALAVMGRLALVDLSHLALECLHHPIAEVRAAALAAYTQLGYAPQEAYVIIVESAADKEMVVRQQAARALALVPSSQASPRLWLLIADESVWVREAARITLQLMGQAGTALLEFAADHHLDQTGRDAAQQFLAKQHEQKSDTSSEWLWAKV